MAILAADTRGWNAMMLRDEDAAVRLVNVYKARFREFVTLAGGRVVEWSGDGGHAEFSSSIRAVECAVDLLRELFAEGGTPHSEPLALRLAVHVGEVLADGDLIRGTALSVSYRLCAEAVAGGLMASGAVFDQLQGRLPVDTRDLGERRLRGFTQPVRIFQILTGCESEEAAQSTAERRLVAIMLTDVVDYTPAMARDEQVGRRIRERNRDLVSRHAAHHRGDLVDENGDELVLVFPSALDSVNCALAIQEELRGDSELTLRIGIHSGDVTFEGGRVYGDGVNVASRIRPEADPGGICISSEVYYAVRGNPHVEAVPWGERKLKNVDRPITIFALERRAQR